MNHREYKFKSRHTFWILLIFWFTIGISLYAVGLVVLKSSDANIWIHIFFVIMMLLSVGLIFWIWLGTHYVIRDGKLNYYSGPIRGVIPISSIRKIEVGKTLWAGVRPALATGGIIIHYGSSDMIYISPDTNDKFIHCLLDINDQIKVERRLFK